MWRNYNAAACGVIHPSVSQSAEHLKPNPDPPSDLPADDAAATPHTPRAKTDDLSLRPRSSRAALNIFLMRHASAGTRRANQKLDTKRPLDKEGKRHCLQLAQVLNSLRINFDLIVSSPLKRCLQTAQLVGTELGYEARILHAQALEPGADFAQFQRLISECRSYENVLLVGHNPTATEFLGRLIAVGDVRHRSQELAMVRLRKGAIARVTVEQEPGVLKWLLDPRIVRALYATSTKSSRRKVSRK